MMSTSLVGSRLQLKSPAVSLFGCTCMQDPDIEVIWLNKAQNPDDNSDYLIECPKSKADWTIMCFVRQENGLISGINILLDGALFGHEADEWTMRHAREALEMAFHPPIAIGYWKMADE